MFTNFMNDTRVYQAAELYWSELCRQIIADLDLDNEWGSWLNKSFVDGTSFGDGDPIHSLISADQSRALRIRQIPRRKDSEGVSIWFDLFGDDTRVLVLTIAPSEWRVRLCAVLFSVWLDLRVPVGEAERIAKAGSRNLFAE
jgi:hypothetical protein